jgi:hypothetical protein
MKKILSILLNIAIISFLLVSCDKEEPIPPTIVNGQVLEQGTNKPLEGVKVVIIEVTSSGGLLGSQSYYPIDTILTDKDGRYTYQDFVDKTNVHYILRFYKDQYFNLDTPSDEVFVTWNKTSEVITKMFPFAWLTMRVINTKPFDIGDRLHILGPWEAASDDDWFYGNNINEIFTKVIRGGQKIELRWLINKNNQYNSISDSVYIKPHDTTYYQIKY